MSGSRPEPEEVTASAGTSDGLGVYPGTELSLTTADLAAFTCWMRSLLSADRLVAPERISLYRVLREFSPRPFAGRPWNHFRSGSGVCCPCFSGRLYDCPIRDEPTTLPSALVSEPFALPGNSPWATPVITSG